VALGMHGRSNACPRFHDLLTSPSLKLCHERASDHWPHLVRPRGDGVSLSAHRPCGRAATKRSSASTFEHERHCLIIGRTLVFFDLVGESVDQTSSSRCNTRSRKGAARARVHIHGSQNAGSWRNGSAQTAHGNMEFAGERGWLAIGRELCAVVVAGG
jgi:hypothetical protein